MSKFDIKTVKTNSYSMDYIVFGKGKRSFVIIPGLSLRSIIFSAGNIASAYSDFINEYTIYVFDRKHDIKDNYSIKDMAIDTANAMKALSIEKADILGTSQGGMIAQYIAILYPELVNKMVLASTICRQNSIIKSVFDEWITLSVNKDVKALNRAVFSKVYSKEYLEKYSRESEKIENFGTDEELERFTILAKACIDFDVYNKIQNITCPVLVIADTNDEVLGFNSSMEISEKLGCELIMYDKFSHAVYDEATDFKDRILNFFIDKSKTPGRYNV